MKKLLAGAAMAMMGLTGSAYADGHGDFPDRPIMMVVSYGAGGATDFQARIVTMTAGNEDALFNNSLIYGVTDHSLLVIILLFAILVVKPGASALTLGAGGSGGIFAPSLFMGGISGYLFAKTINYVFPVQISTSNFTLVAMCGVMSGVLHAPLTAIFLIAEITA